MKRINNKRASVRLRPTLWPKQRSEQLPRLQLEPAPKILPLVQPVTPRLGHRIFSGPVMGLVMGLSLSSSPAHANTFTIDVDNDDIAIEATNASLRELLQELESITGIPVKFVADTDERVTLNVGMTTVENAIGKITPNHMIVHKSEDGKEVIKELIIIPANSDLSSSGSGSAFLPNGNPAPAIEQPPVEQPQAGQAQTAALPQTDPNQPPTEETIMVPTPTPNDQVN